MSNKVVARLKGQSVQAKFQRLSEGRCPVHGLTMGQTSRWEMFHDGKKRCRVACPRCDLTAWEAIPLGMAVVL